MRFVALLIGFAGVVGAASAGEPNNPLYESDAASGRLVFEARFGGTGSQPALRSFQLQLGSDRQFQTHVVPFRAEYRPDADALLLNGIPLGQNLVANQEEGGLFGFSIAGWVPMAIVVGAAAFVAIDAAADDVSGFVAEISGSGGS